MRNQYLWSTQRVAMAKCAIKLATLSSSGHWLEIIPDILPTQWVKIALHPDN